MAGTDSIPTFPQDHCSFIGGAATPVVAHAMTVYDAICAWCQIRAA